MEQGTKVKDFHLLSKHYTGGSFQGTELFGAPSWADWILAGVNFKEGYIVIKVREGLKNAGQKYSYTLNKDKYNKLPEKTKKKIEDIFEKGIKRGVTIYEILERDVG